MQRSRNSLWRRGDDPGCALLIYRIATIRTQSGSLLSPGIQGYTIARSMLITASVRIPSH